MLFPSVLVSFVYDSGAGKGGRHEKQNGSRESPLKWYFVGRTDEEKKTSFRDPSRPWGAMLYVTHTYIVRSIVVVNVLAINARPDTADHGYNLSVLVGLQVSF